MQYRHVLNDRLRANAPDHASSDPKEIMRLFQFLTMVLMSTYHHQNLTVQASMHSLHDLAHVILSILLEPAVEELPQGDQLIRALNVLTVKIVERSEHTRVTCAFVRLMKESVANNALAPKYIDLVMKCLWKVIRLLPNWNADLDLDTLMSELHDFLKAYPSTYWRQRQAEDVSDLPIRTVKTVLHSLVKMRGDEVLDHLSKIQDPENSELATYVRKLLNKGIGKENTNSNAANGNVVASSNGQSPPQKKHSSTVVPIRFSKSEHETLAEIFKKIGQKEQTKQGLQELYNFKQTAPHADLEPFLAKSSAYFRDYIDSGLKRIERELGGSSNAGEA